MKSPLHDAILDAIRAPGYASRGILVNTLLEATSPLHVNEDLLYRAVYTIFRALPERLVPGTVLEIATVDLPDGGIEIYWEGKERIHVAPAEGADLRDVLVRGPHGDLVDIALLALERYCQMNAGYVDIQRELTESSSFSRPAHVIRRVVAVIPGRAGSAAEPARQDALASREDPRTGAAGPRPRPPRDVRGRARHAVPLLAR